MVAKLPFTDVPGALEEIKAGRMLIVVDDEDRENEGDLTLAAESVTPEAINFMAKHGRGLICLTLTEERADYLRLPPMTQQNSSRFGTAFTETIEAREGVTTGISAHDRAHTIKVAINPVSTANDLARPGHIFPLRARKGGVLVRAGQTEASVDLARMAGMIPAGVICEIMKDDGTMARVPDLVEFCAQHGMKILTVAELIRYRLQNERYIVRVAESEVPTPYGDFRMIAYESEVNGGESHVALVRGDVGSGGEPVDTRQFLPNIQWLLPSFVATQLRAPVTPSSPSGRVSPGTHGSQLSSVSVGGTTLQTGSTNTIPAQPAPTFTLSSSACACRSC